MIFRRGHTMKYLMLLVLSATVLTACGGTTVNVNQVNENTAEQDTKTDTTSQQATGETAVVSKESNTTDDEQPVETVDDRPGDTQLQDVSLTYYTEGEIKNIVDYTIRPASQKIQNAINNKQLSPVTESGIVTEYEIDNVFIRIVDDGHYRSEYTYLDNKLIFLLTLENEQITGRYYFYDGVFIRYLDAAKTEINRPYFTEAIIQEAQDQIRGPYKENY